MSSDSSNRKPSALGTVRPVIVLVVICVVAGTLLGLVHGVTEPLALANEQQREQQIYQELFPNATSFEDVSCDVEGCLSIKSALDASGAKVGTVVHTQSKGYGGQVGLVVAFGEDGLVSNIVAIPTDETPGLGTKVNDESYIGQYVRLPAELLSEDSVDFISGATISSKAVLAAYNIAVQAYLEVQ